MKEMRTMSEKIEIAKVCYEYNVRGKTATITREDGAWAKFHDDESYIDDWEDALVEMIADDSLFFEMM